MKTCTKCKEEKPLDQFHTVARNADGKHHQCKTCVKHYRLDQMRTKPMNKKTTDYWADNIIRQLTGNDY